MMLGFVRMSILWKILLSTSVALTTLFAVTLLIVQRQVARTTFRTLDEAVNISFQAYDSLWRARADKLASVSKVLSRMSDVRGAFSTGDQATIRDTAEELWSAISNQQALFLVTDPAGVVIASLGGAADSFLKGSLPVARAAASQFPAQSSGFMIQDGRMYQVVITPVYIDTQRGQALEAILVAAYVIDSVEANRFKEAAGGSEFVFLSGGRVVASTVSGGLPASESDYAHISKPLLDLNGRRIGELRIYRSLLAARQNIAELLRNIYAIWLAAVAIGMVLTWWLSRRIIEPLKEMNRAAAEIAGENYEVRVSEGRHDELGRLARTLNGMCAALQTARAKLIHQERMATISRLSTSIIHDLRNPLAAIYGGSEMLVDFELPPDQVKRLAANMYRASLRVRELLADLAGVARGKSQTAEICNLREVIAAATEVSAVAAVNQGVEILLSVSGSIELPLERGRMERVFLNLIVNAMEAIPDHGTIDITSEEARDAVIVVVEDTGPGIPPQIREALFEPFVSACKKDGLGLGLALSRQTVLDHGGDMWIEPASGARFVIRLPLKRLPEEMQASMEGTEKCPSGGVTRQEH
ncbi:MAG: HAMP domain-containing histidine kinase [Acidobacteria bacterium]|nr:HAMP domain-containing histidine kinase [Acidobacteriota bacterium]